jgi:C-terminal processing protease CtpA/Prc
MSARIRLARLSLAACVLLLGGTLRAQFIVGRDEAPLPIDAAVRKEVVQTLAKELEAAYVFPDVAKKLAEMLRGKLDKGEYDKLQTGQALAKQLTDDLQGLSHDKHLRVMCSSKPLPKPGQKKPSPEEIKNMQKEMQRRNSGFVKLERMPGNVGYMDLRGFMDHEAGAETVAAAMTFLSHTDALILDLRRNGGGTPKMVQLVCSYLFPADKPIHLNSLYWREGNRTEEFWTLKDLLGKRYVDKDVYVLTSRMTFSGAEECAYNLKTQKRATLVGETTGGGAHPGKGVPLGEHFGAFMPTGRAINPVTKTNWEGTGVEPDVAVDAEKALDTAYELALKKLKEAATDPKAKQRLEDDIKSEQMGQQRFKERKSR